VTRPAGQEISKVLQLGMAIQLPTAFEMWQTLTTANGANYPQGPVPEFARPAPRITENREGRFYDHRHGRVTVPLVSRMARFSQFSYRVNPIAIPHTVLLLVLEYRIIPPAGSATVRRTRIDAPTAAHFSVNCYSKPPATWHLP